LCCFDDVNQGAAEEISDKVLIKDMEVENAFGNLVSWLKQFFNRFQKRRKAHKIVKEKREFLRKTSF